MTLKIKELQKTYKNGTKALDNLTIEIGKGMFGLLGPNGAGKSSLMRTIATLQPPDKGSISFNEIDILKDQMSLRKILGYLPQDFGVYPNVSAETLLDYFAILKGITSKHDRKKMIQEVLGITNLYDVRKKNVEGFSGGMKQRFGIAQLLLNKPQLIIVDEPTAGLDPVERNRFLNVLREIGVENTVIFSTHIVDDIKDLCQQIAILNNGKIILHNLPAQAINSIKGKIWIQIIERKELESSELMYQVLSSKYNTDNTITIRVFSEQRPNSEFTAVDPQLEDVYFISLKNSETIKAN
ncbi:MAG: ABC transporter ATP-binding protein [Bacteroidia bacterium]|nr:ABC transporter ATP-binding protein [Bacteroidia bacterium]